MRILIDGSRVLRKNKAGIGHYTYELVRHLSQIDERHDYTVLIPAQESPQLPNSIRQIQSSKWNLRYLPIDLAAIKSKYDIYHEPNFIPRVFDQKTIVTIHDMSYRLFPQFHPKHRVALLKFFSPE